MAMCLIKNKTLSHVCFNITEHESNLKLGNVSICNE